MKKVYFFLFLNLLKLSVNGQNEEPSKEERFSVHAQTTVITQFKPSFSAPYTGKNSLRTEEEKQTSLTSTLFLGVRLWKGAGFYCNPEIAGGSGLSEALGVAAAPNGETFRIGNPAPKMYLARMFYKQSISLSAETENVESDFNQLGGKMPTRYASFTIGKIGVADFFDDNAYSHDPRTQFMSWGLMDNGAWDYPADTRGYTPSIVLEYVTPQYELRYGLSLLPKEANGSVMNWEISKANSSTLEYTRKYKLKNRAGALRVLGFFATANMGNYRQSLLDNPTTPDITQTRTYGNTKYGFAINAEQAINDFAGCFLRAGFNDGNNETWCFTEIDRSLSAGLSFNGQSWKRKNDNLGIAYVTSGLSQPHRDYLKAGGTGFMLGDGTLNYSWEHLTECYYSAELVKNSIYLTGAYQLLLNPGYNQDRAGPVNIFSVRFHARI